MCPCCVMISGGWRGRSNAVAACVFVDVGRGVGGDGGAGVVGRRGCVAGSRGDRGAWSGGPAGACLGASGQDAGEGRTGVARGYRCAGGAHQGVWGAMAGAREGRADEVIGNVVLRSGFVLGDVSLVAYFDVKDDDPGWSRWRVRLYDAVDQTEQASKELSRGELDVPCGAVREFCRSFGGGSLSSCLCKSI